MIVKSLSGVLEKIRTGTQILGLLFCSTDQLCPLVGRSELSLLIMLRLSLSFKSLHLTLPSTQVRFNCNLQPHFISDSAISVISMISTPTITSVLASTPSCPFPTGGSDSLYCCCVGNSTTLLIQLILAVY